MGENHQNLFQKIEACASEALIQFNLLEANAKGNIIFKQIRPIISELVGHLNELQGVLENDLITKNN